MAEEDYEVKYNNVKQHVKTTFEQQLIGVIFLVHIEMPKHYSFKVWTCRLEIDHFRNC